MLGRPTEFRWWPLGSVFLQDRTGLSQSRCLLVSFRKSIAFRRTPLPILRLDVGIDWWSIRARHELCQWCGSFSTQELWSYCSLDVCLSWSTTDLSHRVFSISILVEDRRGNVFSSRRRLRELINIPRQIHILFEVSQVLIHCKDRSSLRLASQPRDKYDSNKFEQ